MGSARAPGENQGSGLEWASVILLFVPPFYTLFVSAALTSFPL